MTEPALDPRIRLRVVAAAEAEAGGRTRITGAVENLTAGGRVPVDVLLPAGVQAEPQTVLTYAVMAPPGSAPDFRVWCTRTDVADYVGLVLEAEELREILAELDGAGRRRRGGAPAGHT